VDAADNDVPVPISMAATFDPPLVHDVAAAIADEGRAVYNYWPTVQGRSEQFAGRPVTITADGKRISHNGSSIVPPSSIWIAIRAGEEYGKHSARTRCLLPEPQ